MSFSRFSSNCDVYTFISLRSEYECCGCILRDPYAFVDGKRVRFGLSGSEWCNNATELVEHLRAHQSAGHKVPEVVIAAILEDTDEPEPD